MERMTKGNKVHLEGAKAYGPQDYEVVDEMKILEEENKKLKEYQQRSQSADGEQIERLLGEKIKLEEENKKLREFKTKREESMFYFKAQIERAEPINSKEAEELQKYKKLFEKLYREELSCLEEENKKLKEENEKLRIDREFEKGNTIFGM